MGIHKLRLHLPVDSRMKGQMGLFQSDLAERTQSQTVGVKVALSDALSPLSLSSAPVRVSSFRFHVTHLSAQRSTGTGCSTASHEERGRT